MRSLSCCIISNQNGAPHLGLHSFPVILSFSSTVTVDFPLLLPLGFFPPLSLLLSLSLLKIRYVLSLHVCSLALRTLASVMSLPSDWRACTCVYMSCVVQGHLASDITPPSPPAGPEARWRDQQTQSMGKQRVLCYQGNQIQFVFLPNQPNYLSLS